MRLVIMFQVMQLLLQLLVVQLNCSSNYFYKNLHYFDSHLDCDYSYQKCKKNFDCYCCTTTTCTKQYGSSTAMDLTVLPTLPNDHNSSTISALVWKRRQGLGKLSAKNPWTRPHYPIFYCPKKKLVRLGQSSTYNNHR